MKYTGGSFFWAGTPLQDSGIHTRIVRRMRLPVPDSGLDGLQQSKCSRCSLLSFATILLVLTSEHTERKPNVAEILWLEVHALAAVVHSKALDVVYGPCSRTNWRFILAGYCKKAESRRA